MSTVRATSFQNAGSASVNMALDTAGNATVANTLAMGSSFLRNRIINGDMRIDQRNAGAAVTNNGSQGYNLDRWQTGAYGGGVLQTQQSSTAPAGFKNSLLVTVNTADGSIAAGDLYFLSQSIEGYNVSDLGFGAAGASSVTLSFWVRSSVTGTFSGSLKNSASDRSYPFQYTISSANTFEFKTVTIAGDTSGTWLSTNGIGLTVAFDLGSGTTYTAASGSWAAGNYFGANSSVKLVSTLSATWYITGVQLEVGTVATPFERRQYGQELALCQRYYFKSSPLDTNDSMFPQLNTDNQCGRFSYPVTMRASPSVIIRNGTTDNQVAPVGSGAVAVRGLGGQNVNGFRTINPDPISGFPAGAFCEFNVIASAEL